MALFNRVLSLKVGKPGSEDGVLIKDHRVAFDVEKANTKEPNTAKITIYNIGATAKEAIDLDPVGKVVILEAGYSEDVGTEILYIGSLIDLTYNKNRPDTEYVIMASDGYEAMTSKKFGKSYAKGTKAKTVLNDVVSVFDMPVDGINMGEAGEAEYANGFTAMGPAQSTMDNVADKLKLRWTMQDGRIKVVLDSGPTSAEIVKARDLSSSTGLIGVPQKIIDVDKGVGYQVDSLLLPSVSPDDMVNINGIGAYRVYKINHKGDTHGKDFTSSLTVFQK